MIYNLDIKEMMKMNILFMLPARSGSKGIKDKNIKMLNGKPLMYYAIDAIMSSKTYKKHNCYIFVNTDSEKYAEIAKKRGANVPYIRKKNLANDKSVIVDTIKDAFKYFENKGVRFEIFSLIQITSPLITGLEIDRAVERFHNDTNIDTLVSVTESEVMPLWCNTLNKNLSMNNFISENVRSKNRQELPKYYRITGSIYMAKWESLKKNGFDWYKGNSEALIIDNEKSVDIDNEMDFEWAEFLIKKRR